MTFGHGFDLIRGEFVVADEMKFSRRPIHALFAFVAAALLLACVLPTAALAKPRPKPTPTPTPAPVDPDGTWTANAAGTWSTTTNWLNGIVADVAGSTANFSTIDITAGRTVTIDGAVASRTVGTLLVGDTGGTSESAYTFAATGSGTLTFNNNGAGAVLTQTAATGSNIFNSTLPIILGDNLTINNNAATASTARSLTISGGITGAFNLTLNANGTNSNDITLNTTNINNGGTITNSGTGTGTVTISSTIGTAVTGLAQSSATSQFTISGGITLGTDMTLTSTGTKLTLISSVISGAHSFTIGGNGTGTTTLSGNNTFSNGLTLSTGTLNINSAGTSATNSALGTGTFTINGGTIDNTSAGDITLATTTNNAQIWGGDFTFAGGSGTHNLNLGTGAVTLTANRQIQVTGSTSTLTVGGVIGDSGMGFSLTKNGPGVGTLILTGNSTYSGGTTIGAGTISVSSIGNAGANGNLGTGNINLGTTTVGGTLLYTGGGETTNKVFNLSGTTGGGIIDTTGATGGLILSANFTATGAGTKTLTIRGNTTGNVISGKIVDNLTGTNNTNVTKSGAGTWTLSGANTYSGTTTINGGTLSIDNNNTTTPRLANTSNITINSTGTLLLSQSGGTASIDRINNSATITMAGGTFNTGGLSEYTAGSVPPGMGALTLTSTSIIDLGSGASIIAFANSSASTWTGGTKLNIYNWSGTPLTGGGTDQVYFGTDTTGLTSVQLAQVEFFSGAGTGDLGSAIILADGEIVPIPEPSTWVGGGLALLSVGYTQRRRFGRGRAKV